MRSINEVLSGVLEGNAKAVLFMMVGTIFFSMMHALIRYMSDELHAFELAFFRNLFGAIVVLPWLFRSGFAPLKTERLGLHSVRGIVNGAGMLMFFYAVTITPLADVTALSFTAPIFATVLAIVFLGEVVGARRWTAIFVAFFGALVILRPGLVEISQGQLLALTAAALWACALIMIKVLGRTDSSITIIAYMISFQQLCLMALMGGIGTLGQWLLVEALKAGDTNVVMPFDFLKMIWAVLFGFFFFNEFPDVFTWVGSAIIFGSAIYIAVRERKIVRRVGDKLISRPSDQS